MPGTTIPRFVVVSSTGTGVKFTLPPCVAVVSGERRKFARIDISIGHRTSKRRPRSAVPVVRANVWSPVASQHTIRHFRAWQRDQAAQAERKLKAEERKEQLFNQPSKPRRPRDTSRLERQAELAIQAILRAKWAQAGRSSRSIAPGFVFEVLPELTKAEQSALFDQSTPPLPKHKQGRDSRGKIVELSFLEPVAAKPLKPLNPHPGAPDVSQHEPRTAKPESPPKQFGPRREERNIGCRMRMGGARSAFR